jgi:lipid-binding SYLF domain-containing protein
MVSRIKLSLVAALAGAVVVSSPLVSAAQNAGGNTSQSNASGPQGVVDHSIGVVHRMEGDPHLRALLARSKGVLILPGYGKGAFVVGSKGGEGVLLAHQNGRWSDPAFYGLAGGSIGVQAGGEGGPIAYILMSDNAINSFTSKHNVSLSANAGLTIVTWSGKAQGNIGKADVVLWSGAKGALAGASVGVTDISQDTSANDQYYRGRNVNTVAILQGRVSRNPGAAPLQQSLPA